MNGVVNNHHTTEQVPTSVNLRMSTKTIHKIHVRSTRCYKGSKSSPIKFITLNEMDPMTLHEISRRSILLNKTVETTVYWHHAPLTVLTDKGLHLLNLSHDIQCYDKKIDTLEYSISCPTTSPASKLFPPGLMNSRISSINYNQMLIDPALWPHNPVLMEEIANFVSYTWSPSGFTYNSESVLATVTNMGNIELFGREKLEWKSVLKLSDEIETVYNIESLKINSTVSRDLDSNLKKIRESALSLQTCAFCWGANCDNNSFYFITAQKNGDLLFWNVIADEFLKANFITKISIDTSEIISIHWVPQTDTTFVIIYSNIIGQVNALQFEIKNDTLGLRSSNCLWSHSDRMIVKHLKYTIRDNNLVLLYAKHRHLVVQVLDKSNEVISQYFQNINENRITGITVHGNIFYLHTVNCKLFKINVNLSNDNVSIDLVPISLKDSYPTHELYGFNISNNGVIFALALIDRKVQYRKEPFAVNLLFLVEEDKQSEVTRLINNPSRKLSQVWDCIELIRYKSIKTKTLPQIDYNKFYVECQSDNYKLKVYLIFLTLKKNLEEALWLHTNVSMPETSIEKIKANILFNHAVTVLDRLFKSYQLNDHKLDDFEIECFTSSKKYMEFYCQQYKCNLGDFVNVDIFDIIKTDNVDQLCDSCDENLVGILCRNGHINNFCCITFTQITSIDYIFCPKCSAVARIELKPLKPNCTFCDYGLELF